MPRKPNFFKQLQVMHKAFLTGMLVLMVIIVVLRQASPVLPAGRDFDRVLQVVAIVLAAGLPALGFSLFNKKLVLLQTSAGAKERAAAYRRAAIIRWALIEMPVLFSAICFFLTGNYAYLALAIALVFVFAATNPSKTKVVFQLQLSEPEVSDLENISE